MALEVTLLREDQIFGKRALKMFSEYGTRCGASDLAILQGALRSFYPYRTSDDLLTACYWTASADASGRVGFINSFGDKDYYNPFLRGISVRPALPPSTVASIIDSCVVHHPRGKRYSVFNAFEYPQKVNFSGIVTRRTLCSTKEYWARLDQLGWPTGQYYTFKERKDSYDYERPFRPKKSEVYFAGRRYITVDVWPYDEFGRLNNGTPTAPGCWVEILPVTWLLDNETGWAVSHVALFAGMQFDDKPYYDGNFEQTVVNDYLQKYFAPELVRNSEMFKKTKVPECVVDDGYETAYAGVIGCPSAYARQYRVRNVAVDDTSVQNTSHNSESVGDINVNITVKNDKLNTQKTSNNSNFMHKLIHKYFKDDNQR